MKQLKTINKGTAFAIIQELLSVLSAGQSCTSHNLRHREAYYK